ncbi:MAG: YicC family protein [Pirellulales bacterium]|nr:YicC family protein [Pirellulales bacterium]
MTGFGEAHSHADGLAVAVEIRAINNRYFKLGTRISEGYGALEPLIEATVRKTVRRGTVQVSLQIERQRSADEFRLNLDVLQRYRDQLEGLCRQSSSPPPTLEALLPLPGVADVSSLLLRDAQGDWPLIQPVLEQALEHLSRMRAEEGRAMAADLTANCRTILESLAEVERRTPQVVEQYRIKMHERVQKILDEHAVVLEPGDLIKEVSLLADRADISEEIVRLRSHVDQFLATLELPESAGRKLEFVTQEMVREANTIGSKANDVEIARHVIDIKTAVERIREMIQNVE